MEAVLGAPLEATATVTTEGDDLGIVPQGQVTFLITKSGAGTQEVSTTLDANGQATLEDALAQSSPIIVDLAGTWSVRATYLKTSVDPRYVAEYPLRTDIEHQDVQAGGVILNVDAPATAELGSPVTVHVEVVGAVTPTGRVRVQLSGSGNVLVSEEIWLVDGEADIPIDPSWLTFGPREYVVAYVGDGTFNSRSSDPFTIDVGQTRTTTTVTTSSQVLSLYPGLFGATVQYTAHVSQTSGQPSGIVNFYRDTTLIGAGFLVAGQSQVTMSTTVDAVWAGDIRAEFQPYSGQVAGSTGTLAHSWIHPPVNVTMQGPIGGRIGAPSTYSVRVQFDWDAVPVPRLRPASAGRAERHGHHRRRPRRVVHRGAGRVPRHQRAERGDLPVPVRADRQHRADRDLRR